VAALDGLLRATPADLTDGDRDALRELVRVVDELAVVLAFAVSDEATALRSVFGTAVPIGRTS